MAGSASVPGFERLLTVKLNTNSSTNCHPVPCVSDHDAIVVADFPISAHQSFRAEIATRDGKSIVSLSRWKNTPAGARRTGQSFEFGAHRTAGVVKLLGDVQNVLKATGVDGGTE